MKKRFKFSFLTLALVTMVSFSGMGTSSVKANGIDSSSNIDLSSARYYDEETGQTLTNIYETTENGLREISFEEFKKVRAESKKIETMEQNIKNKSTFKEPNLSSEDISIRQIWRMYIESYHTDPYTGTSYAVSNQLTCPSNNTISCAIAHSFTTSQSDSFSANVSADMKANIKAGVSYTWNSTASTSTTYTITIKPGAKGTVMFQPYFIYTYGELKWYNDATYFGSDWVSGKSPKKLQTGELAGLVYGVVS